MSLRGIVVSFMVLALVAMHMLLGEVEMTPWEVFRAATGHSESELNEVILRTVRIPRTLAALASGVLLAWLGLLMQTWFRNPLAGPGVLGITSGGSLGVALAVLLGWGIPTWLGASVGCLAVLVLIGVGARRFVSPVTTLVFGLMISYAVSAAVTVLESSASAESLQSFVFWGMGTFGKATLWQALALLIAVGMLGAWMRWRSSWLDMWMLGEDLAQTMGVSPSQLHREILLLTGLVLGWVTSVCGPLAFLGLAVPHVYRFFHVQRSHRDAIVGVAAWGVVLALMADGVVRWTDADGGVHWPLNAVLAMLGAPVVVSVLWKRTHDWS
ncbi:MAG: iron ABC transporter permease [Flavobacteriales bacterium]|nr:iron ABC transporter permease [Flavobacteriales bacterium]